MYQPYILAVIALSLRISTSAAVIDASLEPRGSVCSTGIYGELVPVLSGYDIAHAFCSKAYPVKCHSKLTKRSGHTVGSF